MSSSVFTHSHSSFVHLLWTLVLGSRILKPYRPSATIFPSPIQLFPRILQKSFSRPAENPIHALSAAKMRKGALNQQARSCGCNKVAYAHHRDDIIETMMLSLIYEGRFYTFSPRTYLDRMDLTVIRPMMYVSEADIIGFKNKYQLPVCKNPCPVDGKTRREYVKNLIRDLNLENPGVKDRFFHAVLSGNIPGWPSPSSDSRGS